MLQPLCDPDFQRRVWFRLEGPEVSTFEETTGNLMDSYLDHQTLPEYQLYYENEYGALIKQLYEKIHAYTTNSETIYNSVNEEQLLNDPKWLSIVSLSKKTVESLNRRMKEVK